MIELQLGDAQVAFTTRHGGVSDGPYRSLNLGILTDDDPAKVTRNRAIVCEATGVDPERVAMGWQVHGAELREWNVGAEGFETPGADLPRVDGHLTSERDLALLVLVADCLPVALAGGGRAAMLHCGWRGLAEGIIERGVGAFAEPPEAAVGPGIGPCCYEVGEEVLAAFDGLEDVAAGRMLDLRAVAQTLLERAGVRRVEHVDLCTSCRPDLFFSHRRDGGVTGRQAGLTWIPGD